MFRIGTAILIFLILAPCLSYAESWKEDRIVYESWRKSYTYYPGHDPVAKSNYILGFSVEYGNSDGETYLTARDDISHFGLSLSGGKFVLDGCAVSISFDFSQTNIKGRSIKTYGIGPQVSVFFEIDKFYGYPFVRFGPHFVSRTGIENLGGISLTGEFGYAHFVMHNHAVFITFGYRYTILEPASGSITGDTVTFRVGLSTIIR